MIYLSALSNDLSPGGRSLSTPMQVRAAAPSKVLSAAFLPTSRADLQRTLNAPQLKLADERGRLFAATAPPID
jgi:hypothetical protein